MTPLLKKPSLDQNILKNYRSVSNLPYIAKITENHHCSPTPATYIADTDMHEPMQSAYRACQSTEAALVKVCNDLLCAVDERKAVILILLDLSAAFDTIDHGILLDRLIHRLGVCNTPLRFRHKAVHPHSSNIIC